jgi:hypothetical protein
VGRDAPIKIAWLLEHQYSPAGLSFAALKNADAALAKVLRAAATQADCALHLGIVHIEEYGPAEYFGDGFDGQFGWRGYDDEEDQEELASSDDFEVVEVTDGWCYIDHWMNIDDGAAGFGKLPLGEGEVLPVGALDDEVPDEQRVTEATGNEGASFERSYHRAALVIWLRRQFVDVLLQAGVRAALPYLEKRVAPCERLAPDAERFAVCVEAGRVVEAWERVVAREAKALAGYGDLDFDDEDRDEDWEDLVDDEVHFGAGEAEGADRGRMVALLGQLGDAGLLERFIRRVVTPQFDGSEAVALVESARVFDEKRWGELFSRLVQQNIETATRGCVSVFARLIQSQYALGHPERTAALRDVGSAIVAGLPLLGGQLSRVEHGGGSGARKARPVDAEALADLLDGLATLEAASMRNAACAAIVANGRAFDARAVIVPALRTLCERGNSVSGDAEIGRLWLHAADTLLAQSEYPPALPEDWRQNVELACDCTDCRALQAFARDPVERAHRFPLRKDRRKHLHWQIDQQRLDMTHVTERRGRPYTLVCTKTRWSYERRCEAYRQEVAALGVLANLGEEAPGAFAARCARIAVARQRATTVPNRTSKLN